MSHYYPASDEGKSYAPVFPHVQEGDLRWCSELSNLTICSRCLFYVCLHASVFKQEEKHGADEIEEIYEVAAGTLRASHGVPSLTAINLKKTILLLKLHPRRLVARGLAPRRLLRAAATSAPAIAVPNESVSQHQSTVADGSASDDQDKGDDQNNQDVEASVGEGPIHAALVAGGIWVRPCETRPLLHALGVRPWRLVRLGLVDRHALHPRAGRAGPCPGVPVHGRRRMWARGRGRGRGQGHGHPQGWAHCGRARRAPPCGTHGPPPPSTSGHVSV